MNVNNLKVLIKLEEIKARIDSMKADNSDRLDKGQSIAWSYDHFDGYADDINSLLDEVTE